jgi:hypothetical protein
MNSATQIEPRQNSLLKMAIEAVCGAILGAAAISGYIFYARSLAWADVFALVIAMTCFIGAARLFAESFDPAALARRLGLEEAGTEKEKREVRMQALVAAAFGVAVIWPPIAAVNGAAAPSWSYILIAAILALQIWSYWQSSKSQDEYARAHARQITIGGALVGQTLLLAYACAERLGLVPTLTAWEVFMAFTAITIIVPLFSMKAKVVT